MQVKKYDPRVSDILGVALIALALMEILFALLTARTVPSIFSLLIAVLLQLPMYFVPVFFVVFAYKRLRWSMPELAREMDYNRRAMLTVSTFGGIVIMQTLYAAVFPSTVPSVGVKDAESLLAFLLLSFSSVVLPAMLEELFFRGIVLRALTVYRALMAILVSSLVNALLCFSLEAFPIRFFCAFLIGSLYYATGSLSVAISVHVMTNAVWFLSETVEVYASAQHGLFMRVLVVSCTLLLAFGLPFLKRTVRAILADVDDEQVMPSSHFWSVPIIVFLVLAVGIQLLLASW